MFVVIEDKYYTIYNNSNGSMYYLKDRKRIQVSQDAIIVPKKVKEKHPQIKK